MSRPFRMAIVGAGRIASDYAAALDGIEDAVLAAVVDVNPDAAAALAGPAGAATFGGVQEMLAAGGCDGALVSAPPALHPALVAELLEADVPVLCEKPLCITSAEAQELCDLARDRDVVFTMATKFRFVDDVAEAKRLILDGRIGEVLLFENAFTGRVDMTGRWNADRAVSGGGVLIDNGTHSVDLIRHFLGPIDSVQAIEGKRMQDVDVEDSVTVFCRSRSGAMCTVDLSWSLNKELSTYLSIYGSEGALRLGWKGGRVKGVGDEDWVGFGTGYSKVAAFRNQVRDFIGAARGEHQAEVSMRDALASVRVIEAAYRSIASNRWQPVRTDGPAPEASPGVAAA
ncbi:Gfo/Idh/MocA family protein [Phycisphaera mikurensis]|uniref:Putative oxidoreductase n=1 Tax=Phycisphaera mikurensis (strain NBRC 102666 / KCTC 22515 / FYK2301M01) TaxID=1142394 RepID=I0IFJ4_PHYMF|nr:Gfo/Idh/MocA family oxidoreductase [Phycisphaera mikurensis]MBB6440576.1 putative dehydrogenase [Phycisphaera mikurensis]BAM04032.1 putative oxidoreductase [Phycisphaera mikurensis NBRC 102666]